MMFRERLVVCFESQTNPTNSTDGQCVAQHWTKRGPEFPLSSVLGYDVLSRWLQGLQFLYRILRDFLAMHNFCIINLIILTASDGSWRRKDAFLKIVFYSAQFASMTLSSLNIKINIYWAGQYIPRSAIPKGSQPCSQNAATAAYPETIQSWSHFHNTEIRLISSASVHMLKPMRTAN
jgi:hypothetical protein